MDSHRGDCLPTYSEGLFSSKMLPQTPTPHLVVLQAGAHEGQGYTGRHPARRPHGISFLSIRSLRAVAVRGSPAPFLQEPLALASRGCGPRTKLRGSPRTSVSPPGASVGGAPSFPLCSAGEPGNAKLCKHSLGIHCRRSAARGTREEPLEKFCWSKCTQTRPLSFSPENPSRWG